MLSGFLRYGLYGSSRDGTWLPENENGKYEVDGDLLIYLGFLSEPEQKKYIKYIKETPGFVNIDLTDMEKSEFEQNFDDELKLIAKDGKKYLSCLKSKKDMSELSNMLQTTDWRFVKFKDMMRPLSHKPRNASAQMLLEGADTSKFNFHGDLVNCIACCNWPDKAYEWCERERNWPSGSLVQEITNSVFHLVSKPSPAGDAEIEWRLSFSFAEFKLLEAITGPKLTTYMILKNLINDHAKMGDKKVEALKTYHLKTVFFWECEQQTKDIWNMENIHICVCTVLRSLMNGFRTSYIPHFFIPEINLLDAVALGAADISKTNLDETSQVLLQIIQGLEIKRILKHHDIEAIAVMELASMKVQYLLDTEQLQTKDLRSDMRFVGLSLIRECAPYISDYASIACHSANMGFINKTQLWYIEETLSCCYAMLSACDEKVKSLVMKCKYQHEAMDALYNKVMEYIDEPQLVEEFTKEYMTQPRMHEELLEMVMQQKDHPQMIEKLIMGCRDVPQIIKELIIKYKDQPYVIEELVRKCKDQPLMENLLMQMKDQDETAQEESTDQNQSDTLKTITEIEYQHGTFDDELCPGELTYFPYGQLVLNLALALAELKINRKMEHLLNKIVLSQEGWSLDILTDVMKRVIPDFEWSSEDHLSIHQLAQEGVWKYEIPFDTLLKQKNQASHDRCHGKCWEERLNAAREILFDSGTIPKITLYEITFEGESSVYADGHKLENIGSLLLLRKDKGTGKTNENQFT